MGCVDAWIGCSKVFEVVLAIHAIASFPKRSLSLVVIAFKHGHGLTVDEIHAARIIGRSSSHMLSPFIGPPTSRASRLKLASLAGVGRVRPPHRGLSSVLIHCGC